MVCLVNSINLILNIEYKIDIVNVVQICSDRYNIYDVARFVPAQWYLIYCNCRQKELMISEHSLVMKSKILTLKVRYYWLYTYYNSIRHVVLYSLVQLYIEYAKKIKKCKRNEEEEHDVWCVFDYSFHAPACAVRCVYCVHCANVYFVTTCVRRYVSVIVSLILQY